MSTDSDPAALARGFARALEQLRGSWDLQYVGTRAMPGPAEGQRAPVTDGEEEPASTPEPGPSSPGERAPATAPARAGVSMDPRSSAAAAERPTRPVPPSGDRPPVHAPHPAAPASPRSGDAPRPQSPPPPGRATPRAGESPPPPPPPSQAAGPASGQVAADGAGSGPLTDPTQRAEAAAARRRALAEQARRWSPATKLEYLRRHNVGDCRRCPLSRTRNSIVFGVGNPEADLMFVGEAPGANEDRQGEPFVGRAGELLNRWLEALGMRRDAVYIANVLKCRPPGNRDPRPEEVDRCSPFLQAQIRAIEPKVIVGLGRHAGMLLSRREDMTLRAMRGARLSYDAGAHRDDPSARVRIPLVVTYHPAYVLRQEGDGRQPAPGRVSPTEMVMTDLRRALSIIRGD